MDADRRRALTFEVLAVSAWLILPSVGAKLLTGPRTTPRTDPLGLSVLDSLAFAIGDICLLLFVMWNSGDPWDRFGICRPKAEDFIIGIGDALALFTVCVFPLAFLEHGFRRWHLPRGHGIYAVNYHIYILCLLLLLALWILGLVTSRLVELFERNVYAILAAGVLYAVKYGLNWGAYGAGSGAVVGLISAVVFVRTRSLWPVVVLQFTLNVFSECYG